MLLCSAGGWCSAQGLEAAALRVEAGEQQHTPTQLQPQPVPVRAAHHHPAQHPHLAAQGLQSPLCSAHAAGRLMQASSSSSFSAAGSAQPLVIEADVAEDNHLEGTKQPVLMKFSWVRLYAALWASVALLGLGGWGNGGGTGQGGSSQGQEVAAGQC